MNISWIHPTGKFDLLVSSSSSLSLLEIVVSQNLGRGGEGITCQGWKGGENWSKLCSLRGRVLTPALIMKGEM